MDYEALGLHKTPVFSLSESAVFASVLTKANLGKGHSCVIEVFQNN